MDIIEPMLATFVGTLIVLALASISGMFSERVGIVNIGINGMMIIGALSYAMFSYWINVKTPWIQLFVIPLAGIIAMIFSWLHGLATIKLKSDHIISGVAINALALGIALILMNVLGTANKFPFPQDELALHTSKFNWQNIISFKTFILIVVVIASFVFLNKTKWGLRMKAVGENPQAVDVAGINVYKMKWIGVSISGFLAGISGAILAHIIGPVTFDGTVGGLGFLALAIMIMGRWRTIPILIAAMLFALVYTFSSLVGASSSESLKIFKDFSFLLYTLPFVMTLIFLTVFSKKAKGPKAAGTTYDKSTR